MSKLYYQDPYIQDFTAEVQSIIEKNGAFHIVLDQTAFYPGGGGQPSDIGFIEDCPITYVYEEDDCIYHVSSKKPIKIHKAKCRIDWARRFDHMQQHMAQHILSACLSETCSANTLSFHLGTDTCTIDIDQILSSTQLMEIEKQVNEIINSYTLTSILYPTKQELKKLPLPKPLPKVTGPLRLVQIGDIDLSACCGTHPRSTLEVQLLKIVKSEKHKGGTRIYFMAGTRAISALMSNEETHMSKVQELTSKCQKLESEVRKLKHLITDYQVKEIIDTAPVVNNIHLIKEVYEDMELKDLQTLASKLVQYPHVIAILGLKCDKTANLVFMCSQDIKKISMNHLLKDSITLIDGRGGGTDFSAQGGGKSGNNLDSALDYAMMKVKSHLEDKK